MNHDCHDVPPPVRHSREGENPEGQSRVSPIHGGNVRRTKGARNTKHTTAPFGYAISPAERGKPFPVDSPLRLRKGLGGCFHSAAPGIPYEHRFACSRPLALKRRGRHLSPSTSNSPKPEFFPHSKSLLFLIPFQNPRSLSTTWAALCPGAPVTSPPGWPPAPHR